MILLIQFKSLFRSLKSTDIIQPAGSISPEPVILGTSSDIPIQLKVENRRGRQRRTPWTNLFKSNNIELIESGKTPNEIMDMYSGHLSLSLISKWMKDRAKIIKAAAGEYKEMFKYSNIWPTRNIFAHTVSLFKCLV